MAHEAFKTPQDKTSPTQQKGLPGVWDVENALREYTSASALSTASEDILKHVVYDLGLKRAGLYFFNPDERTLESRFELKGKRLSSPPGKATISLDAEGDAMAHTAREALAGKTEAHHFTDARRDPRSSRGHIEFQEFATVPLFDDNQKLVGVIWADNEDKKEITGEQLFGLNLLSKLGGAMIRGAQVKDYQDNLLYAVTAHANKLKLDDTIEDIMEAALKVSGADKVDIRLRNVHTLHDTDIYMKGFSEKERESLKLYIDEVRKKGKTRPLIRELLEKKDVEVINVKDEVAKGKDSRVDPELMRDIAMEDGVICNIPIELKGEDIVAMRVYYKDPEKAKHANIGRLRALTNVTASAIINARTHGMMKALAGGIIHDAQNDNNTIITEAEDIEQNLTSDRESLGIVRTNIAKLSPLLEGNQDALDLVSEAIKNLTTISSRNEEMLESVVTIDGRATRIADATTSFKMDTWYRTKERMEFPWVPIRVKDLIDRSVNGHSKYAQMKNVRLEVDLAVPQDSTFIGSQMHLPHALDNLVNNAIKFTAGKKFPKGEHGQVTVGAREASDNGEKYVDIYVRDNGVGIPESEIGSVTKEFYKGRYSTQDGTGLGLFNVENVVRSHGGDLKVESTEGQGTTITMKIPLISISGMLSGIVLKKAEEKTG